MLLDLVGTKEAAEILGVTRTRLGQMCGLYASPTGPHPSFPKPIAKLAATWVWERNDIVAFGDIPRVAGLKADQVAPEILEYIRDAYALARSLGRTFSPDAGDVAVRVCRGTADLKELDEALNLTYKENI